MQQKKEASCDKYLNKLQKENKISELSQIFREFLKERFNLTHQYTFLEIQHLIKKRRLPLELQGLLTLACQDFEEIGYRAKKPTKKDISDIKNVLRQIIRSCCSETKEETFLTKIIQKKSKKKFQNSLKKKEIQKEKLVRKEKITQVKKKIEKTPVHVERFMPPSEVKQAKKKPKNKAEPKKKSYLGIDEESKEIKKFISASQKVGMPKEEIRKELKELGFEKAKISYALKNLK